MKRAGVVLACGALATVAAARPAAPAASARALDAVTACRAITDGPARLACYDSNVEALQGAEARRDIVVVDRAAVQKTRRSLFGFSLPSLDLFGGGGGGKPGKADEDEVKEVTEPVRSARQDGEGNWIVVLESGATWHQTEGQLALAPKVGASVTIRRGAIGSYWMKVGAQPGVKVKREG